jgi:hypothetical protein
VELDKKQNDLPTLETERSLQKAWEFDESAVSLVPQDTFSPEMKNTYKQYTTTVHA